MLRHAGNRWVPESRHTYPARVAALSVAPNELSGPFHTRDCDATCGELGSGHAGVCFMWRTGQADFSMFVERGVKYWGIRIDLTQTALHAAGSIRLLGARDCDSRDCDASCGELGAGRGGVSVLLRWQQLARRRIGRGGTVCGTRGTSGFHKAVTPIPHAWLH